MPKVRLTNTVVEKATCPPGKDRGEWWDTVSTGLVLRVTDGGAKSWYAIYRSPVTNKQTKLRLGDVKETLASNGLTLAQARSENVKVQCAIDAGRDPRLERKRAQAEERRQLKAEWHERSRATFRVLVDDYLAQKQGLRPGTLKTYLSVLNREILPELGNKLVRELTALDLEVLVERVVKRGRKARARTVKTALGSIWGWARRTAKWRELGLTRDIVLEINPDLTSKGEPRKRKLSDDELRGLWHAVEASNLGVPTRIAFKLTVLLGERSTELIHAPWSEIVDLDGASPRWILPAERNKGKTEKVLPLPPLAVRLLRDLRSITGESPWLIPGRSGKSRPAHEGLLTGSLRHLRNQGLLKCPPFSPHDLRRTMANRMGDELDISDDAIKAVLGHKRSDVTSAHYTQSQKLGPKRVALFAWEQRVKEIVGLDQPDESVVRIVALKRV